MLYLAIKALFPEIDFCIIKNSFQKCRLLSLVNAFLFKKRQQKLKAPNKVLFSAKKIISKKLIRKELIRS
jgi:hypothetical protein